MSPSHVLEPTYQSLLRMLLTNTWPPGTRLETARLADLLGVSATPVRDSLNRLLGERLVDFAPGIGFQVLRLGEGRVRELLACQLALLRAALEAGPSEAGDPSNRPVDASWDMPEHQMLLGVAAFGPNRELQTLLTQVSLRLEPVRQAERALFTDHTAELAEIELLIISGKQEPVAAKLAQYHDRRSDAAPKLVAWLERN